MKGSKSLPVFLFLLLILVIVVLQAQFSAAATFGDNQPLNAFAVTNTPTEDSYPPPEDTASSVVDILRTESPSKLSDRGRQRTRFATSSEIELLPLSAYSSVFSDG